MGLTTGKFPPVDEETFLQEPLRNRIRTLALHWVEYGFGSPAIIPLTYIIKLLFVWVFIGSVIVTATSGVGWFWEVGKWWNEPIVYQKFIIWTMLLEGIGIAGSWGPIAGKFKPMTGGILFWARPGTIRLRPWAWIPGTNGDRRTVLDVVLYLGFLASLAIALVLPGTVTASLSAVLPENTSGLVQIWPVVAAIVFLILIGLRDKTIFLAARSEQYLPALVFFVTLGFTDMIVALKLLIVVVWFGAAISKMNYHFVNVIPPMLSNTPFWPPKWLKRSMYRNFPEDIRPSRTAHITAHVMGTIVELVAPLVLLFSNNFWLTLSAVILMVAFCFFIISTFPLAVPLEWNLLFAAATIVLFLGFPAWEGFAVADFSNPWLFAGILAAMLVFPILGNFRPDKVSFLPSLRQYAGNWASALWTFTPGAEQKLDAIVRPTRNQIDQLPLMGYSPFASEVTMQQPAAWRAMHSQGRGLYSVLYDTLTDIDSRTVREAEFGCNSVIGFNFGDGHLHNEDLIRAIQTRCNFAPGEFVVVWVESQPIHKKTQEYKVIDAALGVVQRGTWKVSDAVAAQPWLPDGPIPLQVTWRAATQPPTTATNAQGIPTVDPVTERTHP